VQAQKAEKGPHTECLLDFRGDAQLQPHMRAAGTKKFGQGSRTKENGGTELKLQCYLPAVISRRWRPPHQLRSIPLHAGGRIR